MQTDTSTNIDMIMDLNMTNTKENKKQYIEICICIYTMMRFGALEGGNRIQTLRQILDKSLLLTDTNTNIDMTHTNKIRNKIFRYIYNLYLYVYKYEV